MSQEPVQERVMGTEEEVQAWLDSLGKDDHWALIATAPWCPACQVLKDTMGPAVREVEDALEAPLTIGFARGDYVDFESLEAGGKALAGIRVLPTTYMGKGALVSEERHLGGDPTRLQEALLACFSLKDADERDAHSSMNVQK